MGTNPKYFKHPVEVMEGINLSERNVAGVIHWAFGAEAAMGPEKVGEWSSESKAFSEKNLLPMGHSLHHHNLLPSMQVKIRELDQWITLLEHGGLASFEDVGVRALASRLCRRIGVGAGCPVSKCRAPFVCPRAVTTVLCCRPFRRTCSAASA
jgi:hypothetical protein